MEAIAPGDHKPAHDQWELLLLEAGFVLAAFDGLNDLGDNVHPSAKRIPAPTDQQSTPVPLHRGAQRYFEEVRKTAPAKATKAGS